MWNELKGATGPAGPAGPSGSGGGSSSHYYTPSPEEGVTISGNRVYKGWSVSEYYAMYDGLMATYPKYIKRDIAPYKDMSNTYELRRYIFEPEFGYDKTIYIGAGVHATEHANKVSIARIMQIICENWKENEKIWYLRNKVRIVLIPMINPWGHANNSFVNSNASANTGGAGVNLNRNYDAYWIGPIMSNGSDHNGAAPFSENETKWVRDTISYFGVENIHYGFDLHDAPTQSQFGDFWLNYNTFHESSMHATRNLVWYLAGKYITDRAPFIWHDKDTTTTGVFPVWASKTMGFPASTIEHCYEGLATVFDGTFMTRAIDTYLNAILVNTLADHKAPVFKSNESWFELEWYKAAGDYAFTTAGSTFENIIPKWDSLATNYPEYAAKSATFVTTSDAKQVYHYSFTPRKYSKTVLVVGGRTEPGMEPFNFSIGALRLAELLCSRWVNNDKHLGFIRNNVRMIFVPYLEFTTKYLNSFGYWSSSGVPDTNQINVANIISIMDAIGTIDGVIYQRELNSTNIFSATTDDVFVLASQDSSDISNVQSYVDYLNNKGKGAVAAMNRTATAEFANYVVNTRGKRCVRIDTGIDHAMYEKKKFQFDDSFTDTAVPVAQYLKYNSEVARRITNIVNVTKLMCQ